MQGLKRQVAQFRGKETHIRKRIALAGLTRVKEKNSSKLLRFGPVSDHVNNAVWLVTEISALPMDEDGGNFSIWVVLVESPIIPR